MPRVPDYREPKPQPPRRSHEAQSHRQPYHTHQDAVYSRNSQINPYPDHDHDTIIYSPNRPVKPQYDESTSHSHPKRKIGTFTAHLVASAGEFVGTFMFLYFSFAGQIMLTTQADPAPNGLASSQQNIFTALLYGFSLLINVWAFYRISGGLFNPAVTFGLVLSGAVPPLRGLFLFPAQLIAAMCAAAVVQAMVPGDVAATNTSLSPSTSVVQGVFIEMFMTAELVFVVLMLAAEKSKDTFIAPVGIGLALFVAMMGGVFYTGGSLNPARSLGPAVVSADFPVYHWIYWVGPCLGALVASGFYRFVKFFDYEQVNPGQDSDGQDVEMGKH